MISVTIPTLNSSKTLPLAIMSAQNHDLQENLEVIVIDGGSTDNTLAIAESMGARVIRESGKLLGARRRGLQTAKGEIIVLLDSDQILRPGGLAAAVELLRNGFDMVVFGERVYRPRSLIERLSDLDKQLLSRDVSAQLSPTTGVMLPRAFRRELLEVALSVIPPSLDGVVVAHDHAIIYFECFQVSSKVGYVPDAMWHIESANILSLWRKNFRYGSSTRQLLRTGRYTNLVRSKTRTRAIRGNRELRLRLASLGFLSLKAAAYVTGYAIGARSSPWGKPLGA